MPAGGELLLPELWPPNSADLKNPIDYGIWVILAESVFKVKIRDIDHFEERLGEAWEELSQAHVSKIMRSFRDQERHCLKADGKIFAYER